jgi:hypothetical protein
MRPSVSRRDGDFGSALFFWCNAETSSAAIRTQSVPIEGGNATIG